MQKAKKIYSSTINLKLDAEVLGNDIEDTPIIKVPVDFYTDLPKKEKVFMQFYFHYPALEKPDWFFLQLGEYFYGQEENAVLLNFLKIGEQDFLLYGFFDYTKDTIHNCVHFEFAGRFKGKLPSIITDFTTAPQF